MTTTQDELNNNDAEFAAAFAEDTPAAPEISEDEAFGIMPDTPVEDGSSDGNSDAIGQSLEPAVALAAEDEPTEAALGAAEPGEQIESEQPVEEVKTPEDIQREKSWEGRLRAREAQLAAREAELQALAAKVQGVRRADGGEITGDDLETQAHEDAEPPMVEAVEDAAEQLQQGKSREQVLQALRDDFGDDFVEALQMLTSGVAEETASKIVGQKVGDVSGALDGVMSQLQERDAREHYRQIGAVHPDFMDVANGEDMNNYLATLSDEERQAAEQVIEGGDARSVIALIDAVKKHAEPAGGNHEDDEALANAEGVRSGGLKLPEKPVQSDDYSAAWNEF